MKASAFKKLIKEAVAEAVSETFRSEMKEIILESMKGNPTPQPSPITEHKITREGDTTTMNFNAGDAKKKYMNIIEDMKNGGAAGKALDGPLQLQGPMDTMSEGSSLPNGQVDLNQIAGLLGK